MKYSLIAAATLMGASASSLIPRNQNSPAPGNNLPCGASHYINYQVKSGDGVYKIRDWARKQGYNVGACDIGKASHLNDINVITAGQNLIIPTDCKTVDDTSCKGASPAPAPAATDTCVRGPPEHYTVVKGDTLTIIAQNFNITLQALEDANRNEYPNFDLIYPGNVTNIPVCPGSSCIVIDYTIQKGDIFYNLAKDAHTTVGQIEATNPNADPGNLQIGSHIQLPTKCRLQNEPEPKGCKFCN